MRILLTNDDGIYAPGLRALRAELMKLGEVTVVAPASEQSAVGHSITLLTPLIVQEVLRRAATAPGLGRRGPAGRLRQAGPAGTAARAARPGRQRPQRRLQRRHQRPLLRHRGRRHRGGVLPAAPASPCRWSTPSRSRSTFPRAAGMARRVIEQILAHQPAPGTLFNVNIPSLEKGPIRGVRVVPQNVAPYRETLRPPHRSARPGLLLDQRRTSAVPTRTPTPT